MSAPSPTVAPARTPAELRKFGLQLAAIFVVFGLVSWFVSHHPGRAQIFWALAAALAGFSVALPSTLGPLERVLIKLGERIGRVTTPIVLGSFYYLVLTPSGWLRRMLAGDPLNRSLGDRGKSAWIKRSDRPTAESYRQQF
jgi:Saxitoxin biosynthesis operon protein SxtJ